MDEQHLDESLFIAYVISKQREQELSAAEADALAAWLAKDAANQALYGQLQAAGHLKERWDRLGVYDDPALIEEVMAQIAPATPVRRISRWWAAAAAVTLIAAGALTWNAINKTTPQPTTTVQNTTIQPGKEGAILTLADGSQVSLDTVKNGVIAMQGGAVAKVVNGTLQYEGDANIVAYNTMSTPKGRQFHLTLPDGTGVWLNSASSIRYPTTFAGKERIVYISGEAYFEVAKNGAAPFRVNVNNKADVLVLGTHFNVNAYENENSIATTLVEGSVKVLSGKDQAVISPGEQARVADKIIVTKDVNLEKVMAWKDGLFNFDDCTLDEVMRQLERWYDIDVTFEGKVPDMRMAGKITRGVTLNALLAALEKLGVHYRLEGRNLIVLNVEE